MSQIAVVVGASRGIGLEVARQLADKGWGVIATVRSPVEELDALGVRVETGVELTSEDAVYGLGTKLKREGVGIDLLVVSAGVLVPDAIDQLDLETVHRQLVVNSVGPLRVVSALLPCLISGAKIGLVSSRMGSIADNGSGGYYGYRMSKAALNAAGVSLARDLAPRGIAVAILHPGFVRTAMTGFNGNVEPDHAARGLIERLEDTNMGNTGTFWHADGEVLPW